MISSQAFTATEISLCQIDLDVANLQSEMLLNSMRLVHSI